MSELPLCKSCGRPIERKSKGPDLPVYCSKRCRSLRIGPKDRLLEREIQEMLAKRAPGASLCPSEVARKVDPENWRERMESVRRAGRRLVARGEVEFTQGGRVVDAATVRGPVRIRRYER